MDSLARVLGVFHRGRSDRSRRGYRGEEMGLLGRDAIGDHDFPMGDLASHIETRRQTERSRGMARYFPGPGHERVRFRAGGDPGPNQRIYRGNAKSFRQGNECAHRDRSPGRPVFHRCFHGGFRNATFHLCGGRHRASARVDSGNCDRELFERNSPLRDGRRPPLPADGANGGGVPGPVGISVGDPDSCTHRACLSTI